MDIKFFYYNFAISNIEIMKKLFYLLSLVTFLISCSVDSVENMNTNRGIRPMLEYVDNEPLTVNFNVIKVIKNVFSTHTMWSVNAVDNDGNYIILDFINDDSNNLNDRLLTVTYQKTNNEVLIVTNHYSNNGIFSNILRNDSTNIELLFNCTFSNGESINNGHVNVNLNSSNTIINNY